MKAARALPYALLLLAVAVIPLEAWKALAGADPAGWANTWSMFALLGFVLVGQLMLAVKIGAWTAAAAGSILAGAVVALAANSSGVCPGREQLLLLPCTPRELSLYYLLGLLQWALISFAAVAAIKVVAFSNRLVKQSRGRDS